MKLEPQDIFTNLIYYLEDSGDLAPCKVPTGHRNPVGCLYQTFLV